MIKFNLKLNEQIQYKWKHKELNVYFNLIFTINNKFNVQFTTLLIVCMEKKTLLRKIK